MIYRNGWIKSKHDPEVRYYLSTHAFYGSKHEDSTLLLRKCGWNVTCDNWDKGEVKDEE